MAHYVNPSGRHVLLQVVRIDRGTASLNAVGSNCIENDLNLRLGCKTASSALVHCVGCDYDCSANCVYLTILTPSYQIICSHHGLHNLALSETKSTAQIINADVAVSYRRVCAWAICIRLENGVRSLNFNLVAEDGTVIVVRSRPADSDVNAVLKCCGYNTDRVWLSVRCN